MEHHKAIDMRETEVYHHKLVLETDYKEKIPGLDRLFSG